MIDIQSCPPVEIPTDEDACYCYKREGAYRYLKISQPAQTWQSQGLVNVSIEWRYAHTYRKWVLELGNLPIIGGVTTIAPPTTTTEETTTTTTAEPASTTTGASTTTQEPTIKHKDDKVLKFF
jgi:hypothetical protein